MSAIYIKNMINSSSIPTVNWTGTASKVTSPSLAYRANNQTLYLPLIEPGDSYTNAAGDIKFTYSSSSLSTIHIMYNNKEYVVPNYATPVVTVEITGVSTKSEKVGSGSSGYYKKTVTVSYKAAYKGSGSGGYAKLSYYVAQSQSLSYSKSISGEKQINAGTSGTASIAITANGGNTSATVVIIIGIVSSSGNSTSTTVTFGPSWSWSSGSSGGGSSE